MAGAMLTLDGVGKVKGTLSADTGAAVQFAGNGKDFLKKKI